MMPILRYKLTDVFGFKGVAIRGCLAVLAFAAPGLLADSAGNDNHNGQILVDDDKIQCPNAQFTEIQDAVAAAPPGATIHVCPGTYKRQVTITKPVTITADTGSILQPAAAVAQTTNFNGSNPVVALLLVSNTHDISIDDLTVDGSSAAPTSCSAADYFGVMYQNASGALTHMAVRNINLPAAPGCQTGVGIFIQSGNGGTSRVNISDSSVHDYQKGGIIIDGAGSNSDLEHNYVTGLGSTATLAQNGIQISRGASASLEDNFVNNHLYAACTVTSCPAAATNILVYNSNGISMRNNTLGTAQVGIHVEGNDTQMQNNSVYDNRFDGIDVFGFNLGNGKNNHIESNNIFHTESAAVQVFGNNNHINGNTVNEAAYGIFAFGSSNEVSGNKYFNVIVTGESNWSSTTNAASNRSPVRQAPQVSVH